MWAQAARSEVKSIKDFYVWSAVIRARLIQVQDSIKALEQHHARMLSISFTPLHTLPVELLLYVLELVVWDYSVFHQMRVACFLRLVCSRWNEVILRHPGFFSSVFINVSTVAFPVHLLSSFPIDVTWWIQANDETAKNIPAFESIFSSSICTVRSFHMIFKLKSIPRPSHKVIHSLNMAVVRPSFLLITHLELVNVPLSVQLPGLECFPNLIMLAVKNSMLPKSYPGIPIPLRHLHLQDVLVQSPDRYPPIDPPCPTLLNVCTQLCSLRLQRVRYRRPLLAVHPEPMEFHPIFPVLERLDCSIDCTSSLFLATLIMKASAQTVTELNIFLGSAPGLFGPLEAIRSLAHIVSPSYRIFDFQSHLGFCFIDPKVHQVGTTAPVCGPGPGPEPGSSGLA